MRIPAAAAVAPCRSPAGAKRVNELQEEDLDGRPADAGKPGPGTRLYLTSTHSHRGSCPPDPGEPGPGATAKTAAALSAAGQLSPAQKLPGRAGQSGGGYSASAAESGGRVRPEPVRGDDVSGEMYLLPYTQTASGARLTVVTRACGEFVPPG